MTAWDFLNNNMLWLIVGAVVLMVVLRLTNLNLQAGPLKLTGKKAEQLTTYIATIVRLEVEKATAPSRIRDDARRVVKNYVDQAITIMNQLEMETRKENHQEPGCPDRDRIYEMITTGPIKDYLVSAFMESVEENHIAEKTDAEFKLKNQGLFERVFLGCEALVEDLWVDGSFDVLLVRKKMRDNSHKFLTLFAVLMDDIRSIAIRYAERIKAIDKEVIDTAIIINKKGKV